MTFDHLQQNEPDQLKANRSEHTENQFCKGAVVYRKDTGMAFEVCKTSRANGIEHFSLLCRETGSSICLSKFALEKDYSNNESTSEKGGLRIVRRLSKLLAK
ncbi:hypothetical protein OAS89_02745 [Alphaproteobacteria bacterium]|nr:hypothetical protein [Alphaproteobacteria bacterium]